MFRTLLPILVLFALVAKAFAGDISVIEAHARASLTPNASSGAVYVTLKNTGPVADTLTGVQTAAADVAMLHESKDVDGVMQMRHLDSLDLEAGETLDPKSTGLHIMLMGLKAPLKAGETLTLQLQFANSGLLTLDVPIVSKLAN